LVPVSHALRSACAAAVLLLPAACGEREPPPPPDFHQGRAWAYLGQQMAFGPRYPGDRGAERQLAWLMEELRFRADTVEQQRFTFPGEQGPLKAVNVLARFRPELEDRVLLVAHRDTRRRADGSPDPLDRRRPVPGANVNASGVAVLMELAELFRQQPPPVGVDLLFPDADEYSDTQRLAGVRHFVESMPGYRPRYAVVLQGVGAQHAVFPRDEGSLRLAPEATARLWAAAARLGHDSVFVSASAPELQGQGPVLAAAGIPAVVVADREYGPGNLFWQAYDDGTELASAAMLEVVGRSLAALVYGEPAGEGS
jgi:glutaminyl-peptide cyclotransferase